VDGLARGLPLLRTQLSVIANLDGSLDCVSDEELARLHPSDRDDEEQTERPCSRCGGDLLLHWHGPFMIGVWMEFCPACDAHCPAASAFIRWYRDADRDSKALPQLFEDWETETMHAHGWARAAQPAPPPSAPAPPGLAPRGRG
jgi:hypothetical protein